MRALLIGLLMLLVCACSPDVPVTSMTPAQREPSIATATRFVELLVTNRYVEAHEMLTMDTRREYPPQRLQKTYEDMISWGKGPGSLRDGDIGFLDDWRLPVRLPGDIGLVYVGIGGEDFVEGVTVVIALESGAPKVRHIEWGRP